MKRIFAGLLSIGIAMAATAAPSIDVFQPRADRYDVAWGAIQLGEGTISLAPLANNCYRLSSVTRPAAIVRWTYGAPREVSEFCLERGRIIPRHFEYVNEKRTKDSFTLDFDWRQNTLKTFKNGEMSLRELPGMTYDRLLVQLAVRQWMVQTQGNLAPEGVELRVADHRRIKTYRFARKGEEQVEVPAGRFHAIIIERVDDPKNVLRFWLAPEQGYIPVKVQHIERGELRLQMQLRG